MKYIDIPIPHLPVTLAFIITDEPLKARNSLVKKHGIKKYPELDFMGLCTTDEGGNFWLTFRNDASMGTVAHEVFHAVFHMLDWCDIKFNIENDENHAYMIGYVVDEITKSIK